MSEIINSQTNHTEKIIDKEKYTQLMASNLKVLRAKAGQTIVQAEATHKLSWGTYLSLVFLFSTDEGTFELMRLLDIYPENLKLTSFTDEGE